MVFWCSGKISQKRRLLTWLLPVKAGKGDSRGKSPKSKGNTQDSVSVMKGQNTGMM